MGTTLICIVCDTIIIRTVSLPIKCTIFHLVEARFCVEIVLECKEALH